VKLKDYREKRMQDPEMQAAYQRLRPKLELGRQILHARLERGWTQEELAEKAQTKQANISRLENALLNPTIEMLQKLANALGTRLVIELGPEEGGVQVEQQTAEQGISGKMLGDFEYPVDLTTYERFRSQVRFTGIPAEEAGRHYFYVGLQEEGEIEWRRVAAVPLTIAFRPPEEDLQEEDEPGEED
jgi:transcriptional regulator with XRE-family HTH domain